MPSQDPEVVRAGQKKHYEANKPLYKARARAHTLTQRALLRRVVQEAKEATPCADCGGSFPAVCMDFDHAGAEKYDAIANMVGRQVSVERLLAEIEKCEVVCANCHRIREGKARDNVRLAP